jgi:hypothetical protein
LKKRESYVCFTSGYADYKRAYSASMTQKLLSFTYVSWVKVERQERNVLNRKQEIQKMATACLIAVFAVNLVQQIQVRHILSLILHLRCGEI